MAAWNAEGIGKAWGLGLSLMLTFAVGRLAMAESQVCSRQDVLVSGEDCTWFPRAQGHAGRGLAWTWAVREPQEGQVPQDTGTSRAPEVEQTTLFKVRVTGADAGAVLGEAFVTVLPRAFFFPKVNTPAANPSEPFPFLIPGTHRRYGPSTVVQPWFPPRSLASNPRLVVGYDLPVTLGWEALEDAEAELLSYREGDRFGCLDMTGRTAATLRFRGQVTGATLEALRHGTGIGQAWRSFQRCFSVGLRGMVALAGDPGGEPGHLDGQGLAARFREPVGLAVLGGGLHCPTELVVADAASHTVRTLTREGAVAGGWGRDGEPGHRDGGPEEARFHHPAFLAVNRWFQEPEACQYSRAFLVADAGNHVIRGVDAKGWVSTLAGMPGVAGFQDAEDPGQARFDQPQGLAMDREGNVWVADRGNHVLRKIAHGGPVTTLAGEPGMPGDQDGQGSQARFGALTGLTLACDGNLYVLDGHALRKVTLDGQVTTILGTPQEPGFRDDWERGEGHLAGVPCLRSPSAVAAAWKRLYIADLGNHALREYDLTSGTLRTVVGDPLQGRVGMGLLRDGLPGPLAPGYATLEAPRGLAVCDRGDVYVTSRTCVVKACPQHLPAGAVSGPELRLGSPSATQGKPLAVAFRMPDGDGQGRSTGYVLEFVNADGTVAERLEGTGCGGQWLSGSGTWLSPGEGQVRLRCVTDQGWSSGTHRAVWVY